MDTHWIKVFHRTDDHYIIILVPEEFEFKFFPSQDCLFHEYFVGWGCIEASAECFFKLLFLHDKAAACTTEGIARAYYEWEANGLSSFHTLEERVGDIAWGNLHPEFQDMITKGFAVFGQFDSSDIYADEADIIFFPDTTFVGFYSQVECGLATHSGKYGIDLALFEDLDDTFDREWEQIDMVGGDGVRHDRGRVAVDQTDFDPFFAEGSGGLGA